MKDIVYSQHFEHRLILREIQGKTPEEIYRNPGDIFFDIETGYHIITKKMKYKNKIRELALVYEETDEHIVFITIHPVSEMQKLNRIKTGRWKRI